MYSIVGNCPHCGAPIYSYMYWNGVIPPTPIYSCVCRLYIVPYPYYPIPINPYQNPINPIQYSYTTEPPFDGPYSRTSKLMNDIFIN